MTTDAVIEDNGDIVADPDPMLDAEFDVDEEDEEESDINMDDIDQEGIELQMSESES